MPTGPVDSDTLCYALLAHSGCQTRRAWHRESQSVSLAWATTSDGESAGGGRNAGAGRSADDGNDARH
jgi:hypothetical protein